MAPPTPSQRCPLPLPEGRRRGSGRGRVFGHGLDSNRSWTLLHWKESREERWRISDVWEIFSLPGETRRAARGLPVLAFTSPSPPVGERAGVRWLLRRYYPDLDLVGRRGELRFDAGSRRGIALGHPLVPPPNHLRQIPDVRHPQRRSHGPCRFAGDFPNIAGQ